MPRTKTSITLLAAATLLCSFATWAQSDNPNRQQTARQALLEMFFSKTPGTFMEHLPAVTRAALDKSGALGAIQPYSAFMKRLDNRNGPLQTFETGPVLLSLQDEKTGQKFEVLVEKDLLRANRDDIEISFRSYKDGVMQQTPFMPRLALSMKTESGVWTLNEIAVTVRLPLADPDFLKGITDKMQAQMAAGAQMHAAMQPRVEMLNHPLGSDVSIVSAMRSIITAENTYASTYQSVGFTCTLSDLDGFGGGTPNEHQAMLIHSDLASGRRFGYVFTLSGCYNAPASGFLLTAVPNGNGLGRKAFCADQNGVIRSSLETNVNACLATGTPVQ